MASAIKEALPSRIKDEFSDGGFARKHHGKTQSHMVSLSSLLFSVLKHCEFTKLIVNES